MIAKEVATKDVHAWLDSMDVLPEAREKDVVKIFIDQLIDSVSKGYLVINEDKSITQKLRVPLGDGATKEIKYDFRYTVGEYHDKLKVVPELDEIATALAKLSLISKQSVEVIRRFDKKDYTVARSLVIFF